MNYYIQDREIWWRDSKRLRETLFGFWGLSVHSFICSINRHLLRANSTLFQKVKGRLRHVCSHKELSDLLGRREIIHFFSLALTVSKGYQGTEMAKPTTHGSGTNEERHHRECVFELHWYRSLPGGEETAGILQSRRHMEMLGTMRLECWRPPRVRAQDAKDGE